MPEVNLREDCRRVQELGHPPPLRPISQRACFQEMLSNTALQTHILAIDSPCGGEEALGPLWRQRANPLVPTFQRRDDGIEIKAELSTLHKEELLTLRLQFATAVIDHVLRDLYTALMIQNGDRP